MRRGRSRLRGLLGAAGARVPRVEDAVHARCSTNSKAPFYKWFADGTLNVSYNCLDRNIERGLGDKTAIIFEADDGAGHQGQLSRAARPRLPGSPTR